MITSNNHTGTTIGGYHLVAEIASGPSGQVFLGKRLGPDGAEVTAAVKVFRPASEGVRQHRESFLKEAHQLQQLHHPHILPILDAGVDRGVPFIITEYASGGSLRDRMQRQALQPLSSEEALAILSQVAGAIQYAQYHNVLHSNLKPSNILFNARGEALVGDFSMSTLPAMIQGNANGSSVYLAPEQYVGIVSPESDQYALGSIAYAMLTGRQPFEDQPGPQYKSEQLLPPSQLNPSLSLAVDQAILTAMAKGITQRHKGIQAFLNALSGPALPELPPVPAETALIAEQDTQEQPPLPPASVPLILPPPNTFGQFSAETATIAGPESSPLYAPPQQPYPGISQSSLPAAPRGFVQPKARVGMYPAPVQPGLLSTIRGVPQRNRKGRLTREQILMLVACIIVVFSVGGILLYISSAASPQQASTPLHTSGNSPVTVTPSTSAPTPTPIPATTPTTASGLPVVSSTPTPAAATPTQQPSPTPLPSPTATPTPQPVVQLSLNPTQLNSSNCRNQGYGYRCTITLTLNASANGTISWSASASGIGVFFSPSKGTLTPGQSVRITVNIFASCKTHGTLTFTGQASTVTAQWGC